MADGDPLILRSARRRIVLDKARLPEKGAERELTQRVVRWTEPGSGEASAQVMGVEMEPVQWSITLHAADEGDAPYQVLADLQGMLRDGEEVTATWGETFSLTGLLTGVAPKDERQGRLPVDLTFEPMSDGTSTPDSVERRVQSRADVRSAAEAMLAEMQALRAAQEAVAAAALGRAAASGATLLAKQAVDADVDDLRAAAQTLTRVATPDIVETHLAIAQDAARRARDLVVELDELTADDVDLGTADDTLVLWTWRVAARAALSGFAGRALDAADALAGIRSGRRQRRVYVVVAGDTLQSIAARTEVFGDWTAWRRLADANGLGPADALLPGTRLLIPTAE